MEAEDLTENKKVDANVTLENALEQKEIEQRRESNMLINVS